MLKWHDERAVLVSDSIQVNCLEMDYSNEHKTITHLKDPISNPRVLSLTSSAQHTICKSFYSKYKSRINYVLLACGYLTLFMMKGWSL